MFANRTSPSRGRRHRALGLAVLAHGGSAALPGITVVGARVCGHQVPTAWNRWHRRLPRRADLRGLPRRHRRNPGRRPHLAVRALGGARAHFSNAGWDVRLPPSTRFPEGERVQVKSLPPRAHLRGGWGRLPAEPSRDAGSRRRRRLVRADAAELERGVGAQFDAAPRSARPWPGRPGMARVQTRAVTGATRLRRGRP